MTHPHRVTRLVLVCDVCGDTIWSWTADPQQNPDHERWARGEVARVAADVTVDLLGHPDGWHVCPACDPLIAAAIGEAIAAKLARDRQRVDNRGGQA
jgi:hypothetical protein